MTVIAGVTILLFLLGFYFSLTGTNTLIVIIAFAAIGGALVWWAVPRILSRRKN